MDERATRNEQFLSSEAIRCLIRKDVAALSEMHSELGPSSFMQMSRSRSADPDDPFEVSLCKLLQQRGVELVRANGREELAKTGFLSPSRALEILEENLTFLHGQWLAVGFPNAVMMLSEKTQVCGLYGFLRSELNQMLEAWPDVMASVEPAAPRHARIAEKPKPKFPRRAAWFEEQRQKRGWTINRLEERHGLEHRTIQKILKGKPVREDVLRRVAAAFKVERNAIPND